MSFATEECAAKRNMDINHAYYPFSDFVSRVSDKFSIVHITRRAAEASGPFYFTDCFPSEAETAISATNRPPHDSFDLT